MPEREMVDANPEKLIAGLTARRRPSQPRKPGSMAGEIWIADDFDELPPEIAAAFGAA